MQQADFLIYHLLKPELVVRTQNKDRETMRWLHNYKTAKINLE